MVRPVLTSRMTEKATWPATRKRRAPLPAAAPMRAPWRRLLFMALLDDAFRVDQEQASQGNSGFFKQNAITATDFLVHVRKEWEINLAKPALVPFPCIEADGYG